MTYMNSTTTYTAIEYPTLNTRPDGNKEYVHTSGMA